VRTAHGYWKKQQQLQRWKTKVFQLQQVWPHSQGMLEQEERERNQEVFQVQQSVMNLNP